MLLSTKFQARQSSTFPLESSSIPLLHLSLPFSSGGAYTFAWSNSSTPEDISGLSSGTYSVTVTDCDGCSSSAAYVVAGSSTGCTDPAACNYDPAATVDDGSCLTAYGCTDATACNYDASATCDDGSCILPDGCTDPTASNYDASATCDDGSCIPCVYGCTDPKSVARDCRPPDCRPPVE